MDIKIDKEKILNKVSMNVSTLARNLTDSSGNSTYDIVRIQDRDKELLGSYYTRAVGELTLSLRNFIIDSHDDTIVLYLNERINVGLVSDIQNLIDEYVVNNVVSEWLKLKSPENYEKFQTSAESTLTILLDKLYYQNAQTDEDITNEQRFICALDCPENGFGKNVYGITLLKNIILGDIDKELFSMYKARKQNADVLQANILESHSQISTYITKHTKRITERIAAYIVAFSHHNSSDNNTERVPSYKYIIKMPCSWDMFNLEQLAEEMHTYVVQASLSDYTRINFPNESLIFRGAADAAWDSIKHAVSVRRGGVRKPLQPF